MGVRGKPHTQTALRRRNNLHYPLNMRERRHNSRSRRCGEEINLLLSLFDPSILSFMQEKTKMSSEGDRVCCFLVLSSNPQDILVMYGEITTLKFIRKFLSLFRLINRKRNDTDSDIVYSV
jgi:hypothetical protein